MDLPKSITTEAWEKLEALVPNKNTFRTQRKAFRDALNKEFPPKTDLTKSKPKGYYITSAGKGESERYEHLSLWYATTNKNRWEVVGDEARAEYFANLPKISTVEDQDQTHKPSSKQLDTKQPKQAIKEVLQPTISLKSMTLQHLELDPETQKTVTDALNHSGMDLADFLRQACAVYARTVMGRVGQVNDDLSSVSTADLRDLPKYKTHPGRPAELVKRAIKAIKLHNSNATELAYKWGITQTLLQELTGSRPAMVKELMKEFSSDINDYNARLMADHGLDETKFRYLNRKDKSVVKPDLVAIVPDGLD